MFRKIAKYAAIGCISLFMLYLLVGFVGIPFLAKAFGPGIVNDKIAGQCRIGRIGLNPLSFALSVNDLQLESPDGELVLSLKRAHANVDPFAFLFAKRIQLRELTVRGLDLNVRMDKDGVLNLVETIAPREPIEPVEDPAGGAVKEEAVAASDEVVIPDFYVGLLAINEVSVSFADERGEQPFTKTIEQLTLRMEDVSSDPEKLNELLFEFTTGSDEVVRLNLDFQFNPLSVDGFFEVIALKLQDYSPLVESAAEASIGGGELSLSIGFDAQPLSKPLIAHIKDSRLSLSQFEARYGAERTAVLSLEQLSVAPVSATATLPEDGLPQASAELGVSLEDCSVRWTEAEQPFVSFDAFNVETIEFGLEPLSLKIASIDLVSPRIIVERDAQGELALMGLAGPSPDPNSDSGPPVAEDLSDAQGEIAPEPQPESVEAPLDLLINRFAITDGQIHLLDESVNPTAEVSVVPIQLEIQNITLNPEQQTRANLELLVQNRGDIRIESALHLADPGKATLLNCEIEGIPLKAFSPFASQAIGHSIEEGLFSGTLLWKVNANQLDANNQVAIDRIRFGEVDPQYEGSPPPVKLAVATLEDSQGQIGLDLPISGSLDDPSFSILGVVRDVFQQLLTNVVTAPFRIAGGLVGGLLNEGLSAAGVELGKDPSVIEFQHGTEVLTDLGESSLEKMAEMLAKRPKLAARLVASVDPEKDLDAYKEILVDRAIANIAGSSRSDKIRRLYAQIAGEPEPSISPSPSSSSEETVEVAPAPSPRKPTQQGEQFYLTDAGTADQQPRSASQTFYMSGQSRSVFMRPLVKVAPKQTMADEPEETQEQGNPPQSEDPATSSPSVTGPTIHEMKAAILEHQHGDFIDLSELATLRQQAVVAWFQANTAIDSTRLYLAERPKRVGAFLFFEATTKSETDN
jgi:hypothetical protein